MVLFLIETGAPLDEVVFYDTGMEFNAIYSIRDKMLPILKRNGIKYTELKPKEPFLYTMLDRPCESKEKGRHNGYGWCGGVCRWGTTAKQKALDEYSEKLGAMVYIGIAKDETKRLLKTAKPYKIYPLPNAGFAEKDCLVYCRKNGFQWDENGIDLYEILDRVSCWCCCNKNRKELFNIYKYLPEYWEKLKELQSRIGRPMKKFRNKQWGDYGDVFEMEKVFEFELQNQKEVNR